MSGWGYFVLLVVFIALSLGMRFLLLRRGNEKATYRNKKHDKRQDV